MNEETLKDKTAHGLMWGMMNNGAMQLLNIVFGIILARLLSDGDYGLAGELAIFSAIAAALHEPELLWLSRYAFLGFLLASTSIVPRTI